MIMHLRTYLSHTFMDFALKLVILNCRLEKPEGLKNPKSLKLEGPGFMLGPSPKSLRA